MKVNVEKFLAEAGITEPFYPGKRLVHPCRLPGEFKSHCVVLDWRDPARIRIEVKPGLSGKDLAVAQVKQYPVSFQTPTFVEIEIVNDNASARTEDDEDEDDRPSKTGVSCLVVPICCCGLIGCGILSATIGAMALCFGFMGRVPGSESQAMTGIICGGIAVVLGILEAVIGAFVIGLQFGLLNG